MWVSTRLFDHAHDIFGAQDAGNWVEGRCISIYVLIDLQKAYGTVDCTQR